jgi:hypothetical protein
LALFILEEEDALTGMLVKGTVAHVVEDVVGLLGQAVAEPGNGGGCEKVDGDALLEGPAFLDLLLLPGEVEGITVPGTGDDDEDAEGRLEGEGDVGALDVEVAEDGGVAGEVEKVAGLFAVHEFPGEGGEAGEGRVFRIDVELDAEAALALADHAQALVEERASGAGEEGVEELVADLLGACAGGAGGGFAGGRAVRAADGLAEVEEEVAEGIGVEGQAESRAAFTGGGAQDDDGVGVPSHRLDLDRKVLVLDHAILLAEP